MYAGSIRTGGDVAVGRKTYAMAAGYVCVWALFTLAATVSQRVLSGALVLTPMMELVTPWATAVLLALARLSPSHTSRPRK